MLTYAAMFHAAVMAGFNHTHTWCRYFKWLFEIHLSGQIILTQRDWETTPENQS